MVLNFILLEGTIFIGYSKNMSDYKLYMSNRLDSFVREYAHVLRSDSLFGEKIYIIVQNKSIGEWLKLEVARQWGVSANLNIILPENAVRFFIRSFETGRELLTSPAGDGERAVLFMDNLKIIIYKKLEELLHTDRKDMDFSLSLYRSLEKYVKGLSSEESDFEAINSLRLYQLSDSIAGLFYYYGMNCQKLTACWEKGNTFFPADADESIRNHEQWQMALWNELFQKDSPYIHLSSILSSIIEREGVYDGKPARVVLFGSTFMGDSSLRFFNHLSRYIPVDHFILSPCCKFEDYHMPLLKNWGSLFEGFVDLMKGFSSDNKMENHSEFIDDRETSLLCEIRNRLLNDTVQEDKVFISADDSSLRIVSTRGKWREVEALKNRILKLLDDDPTLNLTDIGVLAPDINEYSHFIEALFPASDNKNIPYNIIDLSGNDDSPFINAFTGLLNLAGSRFTRKELFSLFSNRCFAEKNRISSGEYDRWLELCDGVNIKWAVDELHKKELHLHGGRYNSWESGFDRILEGISLSEDEDPLSAPYELFNESSNISAGKLMHIIRSLHMDINSLEGVKLQLEEWILIWESIMETYLKPSEAHIADSRDRLRLKGCFRDILNMVNELNNLKDLNNRLFDFFMFKSLISEFINKSGGSRGRYLTQGISCASLKPLRAVPFRVIMVLGMNEEVFPAVEDPLSFDLKETPHVKEIIAIDLSRRTSDKYSFLEVFLSAQEKVYLFYTGRNNVDNEALQPSPLISEFFEYLDANFSCEREGAFSLSITEEEKLQPFDKEYFEKDSPLFSYSERDFRLAEIYYSRKKSDNRTTDFDDLPLNTEDSQIEITMADLLKFLKNPVKYFFNNRCRIFMDEFKLLEEDFYENIELDRFEKYSFFEKLVLSGDSDDLSLQPIEDLVDNFCRMQSLRGEIIDSELSIPDRDRITDTTRKIVHNIQSDNLLSSKPEPVTFTFGDSLNLDKAILKSPLIEVSDKVKVKIVGSLPPLYRYGDGTISHIDYTGSSKPAEGHWMLPFIMSKLLPVEIVRDKGLKAMLVSPEEIHSIQLPPVDDKGLKKLVCSFVHNMKKPIPLYREVAQSLKGDKEDLRKRFLESWIDEEGKEARGYSEFKSCPYRIKAYTGLPEVDESTLLQMFESSYMEIHEILNAGKGK